MAAEIHSCNEFNIHSVFLASNSIFGNQPTDDSKNLTVKKHDALIKRVEKNNLLVNKISVLKSLVLQQKTELKTIKKFQQVQTKETLLTSRTNLRNN